MRIIGDTIDVLAAGQIIATHQTSGHKGGYVTDPDHEPDYFAEYKNLWSRAYFLRQGSKIGPATVQTLENLLDSKAVQAQGFKACRNILDLGKSPDNADVLEEACRRLIDDTGRRRAISYTAVKQTMALVRADQAARPTTAGAPAPSRSPRPVTRDTSTAHLAGVEAFRLDKLLGDRKKDS